MNNTASEIPPNGVGALPFTPQYKTNAAFVAIFTILLLVQTLLTIRSRRYYGYAFGMLSGLLLELLGYVAKVQLSHNRLNKNAYIM